MKAILFDLDGTLVDSLSVIIDSYRPAFAEHNIPYPGDKQIAALIGVGLDVIIRSFAPIEAVDALSKSYREYYLMQQRSGAVQLFPTIKTDLLALKNAGFILGIVTSKMSRFTREFLQQTKTTELFEIVIGAEDVVYKKPHPEPLLTAASRVGLAVGDCLYVGDTVHDGEAARSAKMTFVGVLTGAGTQQQLHAYGEVFKNLSELTSALCPHNP